MFKVKGRETGNRISFTQREPGYVATDTATIGGGGKKMNNGVWHDTNGSGGTWTGVKTAGPKPAPHKTKPKHHKPKQKHHRGS
jgi:hypothetical protein